MMAERWLPISGYEGYYEVSDCAHVRSLDRTLPDIRRRNGRLINSPGRKVKGRLLQTPLDSHGYHAVCLSRDGHVKNRKVGRLVAEAFLGPCPPGMELCHGPNGQGDDSLANVSWGTKSKNCGEDKLRDGTFPQGEGNSFAKLTEADVIEIHRLYNSERHLRHSGNRHILSGRTWTHEALAAKFGVNESTIGLILSGKTWGWLVNSERKAQGYEQA